ncbi:MAG TPA: proteasome assembly chaperone family protein [Candidatus Saccharimonadales bacterium]|nr:proteasome assembly chaperone family protein [Candidatus Saccharimonadales bacterium]
MNKTTIYFKKQLKMREPVMIVGLPGIGNVGSLVGEHIKTEMAAEKFASLYSPYFPHQVIMEKKGGLRMVSNRFYHFKNKKGRSIIVLVGDVQAGSPRGQYDVNEKIVEFFKSLGGKTVYTIGGYSMSGQYVQKPRVFGVATSEKLKTELSKNGVIFGQVAGTIWGSAGLIPAMSRRHKLDGACIMGETGMLEIDANAAKAVLEVLKKVINIEIKLDNIEKIQKETEKILKDIENVSKGLQEGTAQGPHNENFTYIR